MPPANRRSWHPPSAGRLLITVELDPVADCHSVERHVGLADLTRRLLDWLDSHRLCATWAVGDPAYSAFTSLVMRSAVAHELAVLGDPNWLGPTAGRTRFARELARRVSHARAAGIDIATLVPRVAEIDRDIDLVIKQQIRAVAGVGGRTAGGRRLPAPRALHYGVWELPVSRSLPTRSTWFSSGARALFRCLRRAAHDGAMFHLVIDAPVVEQEGTRAENTMIWLLQQVAQLCDRGLLQCETLGAASARLSAVPPLAPQRSILRRAG